MYFSKLSIIAMFAAVAVAQNEQKCNVGTLSCCNQVQKSDSKNAIQQFGALAIAIGSVDALIGANCAPVSVIGLSSNSCNAGPVCCKDNTMHGGILVAGCNPINVAA